ncbi:MAG: hypothetical protein ABI776_05965 [Nocardioidaceae bacterium]
MSEFEEMDLDRSTERAWSTFRAGLADRVAAMDDDEFITVEVETSAGEEDSEGAAPYVQLCGWGDLMVRCEVSSNHVLAGRHRLDADAVALLGSLGWSGPGHGPDEGSSNFWADLPLSHADQLAAMTVRALREVFGVTHPAFLTGDLDEQRPGDDLPADDRTPQEPLAVRPEDRDHLRQLVDQALVPVVGHDPEHDEDDDVPVRAGQGLIWVRVMRDAPVVQLFTSLVEDITDLERAAFEVAVLNREQRFFTFVVVDEAVVVHHYLPAFPFAPLHLRIMLTQLSEMGDSVIDDLVVRVGGRRSFEPSTQVPCDVDPTGTEDPAGTEDPMHPALVTILELEHAATGSVDPVLAASICEMDRALVLALIAWVGRRVTECRATLAQASGSGEPGADADHARRELRRSLRTTHLLRQALHVVVEDRASRQPGHDADPLGAPRRGRGHDVPLPGLDDGEQPLWES